MGESYSFELVERAEQLYCVEGHTFEQVATLTGVAISTLKRWADRYGWQESKEKIRQAMSGIRRNTIMLRAKLIENCLTTLNAQDAFAVSALEGLAIKAAEATAKGQASTPALPEQLREIKTDEDAVAALEEAVQIKLNQLLANPGAVNMAAIREVKQVTEMLKEMRAKVTTRDDPTDQAKVLDSETLKNLRIQLGL